MPAKRSPISPSRVIGAILLCGVGLWFAISGHAKFLFGGDPNSAWKRNRVVHVDSQGLDAIAIGAVFIALGIINLAVGIRDRRRIPVFWTGAALLGATLVYGVVQLVLGL